MTLKEIEDSSPLIVNAKSLVTSAGVLFRGQTEKHFESVYSHCVSMPRLSDADRNRAIGLLKGGVTSRVVARRLHVHHSTIAD